MINPGRYKRKKTKSNRTRKTYPVLIPELQQKGVANSLRRRSVATASVAHQNQDVLRPLGANLRKLHAILVFPEVTVPELGRRPLATEFPAALVAALEEIARLSLERPLSDHPLPRRRHGHHHVAKTNSKLETSTDLSAKFEQYGRAHQPVWLSRRFPGELRVRFSGRLLGEMRLKCKKDSVLVFGLPESLCAYFPR